MNVTARKPEDTGRIIVAGRPLPVFHKIEVEPLTGAAGCEIKGVDLSKPLPDGILEEIMRAFEHFLVIMLRGQDLTPEQHKAFTRHFGDIIELPQAPTYGDHHDMQEVRREAHEPVSVVPFTKFHTDSPFLAQPPLILLAALRHLGIDATPGEAETILRGPHMHRYSKAPEHAYDAGLRSEVLNEARAAHGAEIRRGLAWLERAAAEFAPVRDAIRFADGAARL